MHIYEIQQYSMIYGCHKPIKVEMHPTPIAGTIWGMQAIRHVIPYLYSKILALPNTVWQVNGWNYSIFKTIWSLFSSFACVFRPCSLYIYQLKNCWVYWKMKAKQEKQGVDFIIWRASSFFFLPSSSRACKRCTLRREYELWHSRIVLMCIALCAAIWHTSSVGREEKWNVVEMDDLLCLTCTGMHSDGKATAAYLPSEFKED